MAIYVPGRRDRHNRPIRQGSRNIVAVLTLTAMVDMFTVLVIFLLQNYNETGQVLNIPKEVHLPRASAVKELRPAHVVTVSNVEVILDKTRVASFDQVREQKDWMIQPLHALLVKVLRDDELKRKNNMKAKLKEAVKGGGSVMGEEDSMRRITVQADKNIDFLSIKKVMYTITEAGGDEINFAVMKKPKEDEGHP